MGIHIADRAGGLGDYATSQAQDSTASSDSRRLPPPSGSLGVCTGPNSQFYKRKNPNRKPAYIFCLSLSNPEGRLPRKPSHRSLALLPLNYGKNGYQRSAKKSSIYAAIQLIDKRREKGRLFPESESIQMRIAIYARVSTDDKGQDPENQ